MPGKICMLLHEPYPNDIRVSKETQSLIDAGFEIHLICLQRKAEQANEVVNGIQLHRIPIAQSFFWRGIWDIVLAAFFYQPLFLRKLKRLHAKHNFDAVHVHDLPLSATALRIKKIDPQVKVLLDLHENYPEALRIWFAWKKNPIIRLKNKIFFSYQRWLSYEKRVAKKADHVIVVVDEMKQRMVDLHLLNAKKLVTVTNSESTDFVNQPIMPEVYERNEGDFIMAYTGGVGPHRGVDVCVKGMAFLKDLPNIRLEITGTLSKQSHTWLTQLVEENGCQQQVSINGYQPFQKFYSYMKLADINLIPHNRNGHTDNTIPHKLYQGMLTGNPVVVSSAPPLKRIVENLESGLVFEAGNPEDFARQIRLLYENKELKGKLGQNGLRQTMDKENWEKTGKELVAYYSELLKK